MKILKLLLFFSIIFFIVACATTKLQIDENYKYNKPQKKLALDHSFFLLGDAGGSSLYKRDSAISYLAKEIKKAPKNSTLIVLGDNVYPKGIPPENSKKYKQAKHSLQVQIDLAKEFKGKTIFIPGNHDWYNGLKGLKRQEKLVENALDKKSFEPDNGCPLEKIEINDNINVIAIDSQWYVTNWDKHPGINDDCQIKTREKFFEELEGMIKKSQGKITIIAIHHPIFTNGPHGGFYSFKSHMKPFPIFGSIVNILRKTSGSLNVDQQNKKYNELRKKIINISQQNEKIIFVSGHEHSLQYIVRNNLPQIVSGSGSKNTAIKNVNGGIFGVGTQGFAKLNIYQDGSSTVHFYTAKDQKKVFEANVFEKDTLKQISNFLNINLKEKTASIYNEQETNKGKLHKFLWGKRYRKYFGTKVTVPTVNLDTLYGGLTPIRRGGGHQSKSLRLEDKKGKQYVMRALRKDAIKYLQSVVFKDQYVENQLENTLTEDLLMDVFTGSHPYAPFTIDKLAEAINIYHTKPILFYVPKQKKLGEFNTDYGDELYMIEERTDKNHGNKKNFGYSNNLISTDDLRKNLLKDEKYSVDEETYIRARLFDMLIGDWDRHQDQWRWAEFKEKGKIIYKPVPRDRDQAFSIFGDGFLLNFLTKYLGDLKGMRSYSEDLKNPEWFSYSAYPLDMAIISKSGKEVWNKQVERIQTQITDEVINNAMDKLPKEVQDKTIDDIKRKLKGRRKNLQKIANCYYKYLNNFQVIKGTNKNDLFEIERFKNGDTKVTVYRIKDGKKGEIFFKRTYNYKLTKEIWVFGLDDDDEFYINGNANNKTIKLKLIGGLNNDIYNIQEKKHVKIYDQKSKKNTFVTPNVKRKLTDNYETTTYNYKKLKSRSDVLSPAFGLNPDDGLKIGLKNTYLSNNFERNPFTLKQVFSGFYYFATNGYELNYIGEFANFFKKWNLGFEAYYTNPNFARNFFGFGNSSNNTKSNKKEDKDFNRVRIGKLNAGSFVKWKGELGAQIKAGIHFQNYNVERTMGRFIETRFNKSNKLFSGQNFINFEVGYSYKHANNTEFPTLGIDFESKLGYTSNLSENRGFGYNISSLGIIHKLIPNGKLVFASKVKGHFNFNKDFEFYQAANIGANEGLRGFRNERFNGQNSFVHTSDLRWKINKFKTALIPLNLGIYSGFDYGKVWGLPNVTFNTTENRKTLHTSYGGGIFINTGGLLGGSIGYFNSIEGPRLELSLGFNF